MVPVALVMMTLAFDGHWRGGAVNTVTMRWSTPAEPPASTLHWQLAHGPIELASGQLEMPAAGGAAQLHIQTPVVRTHTMLKLICQVRRDGDGALLWQGEHEVLIYPPDPLAVAVRLLNKRTLVVLDQPGELSRALTEAGMPHRRIENAHDLRLRQVDVIIVAPGQLPDASLLASTLMHHAEAGAQVLVLEQPQASSVFGYQVVARARPDSFDRQQEHPLASVAERYGGTMPQLLRPLRLPPDEPAVAVVALPGGRSAPGGDGSNAVAEHAIDAILIVKAVGRGRVVLCQFPLGSWKDDPRSLSFIADALQYIAGPVEPTPPPSRRRRRVAPVVPPSVPTVTVPAGVTAEPGK